MMNGTEAGVNWCPVPEITVPPESFGSSCAGLLGGLPKDSGGTAFGLSRARFRIRSEDGSRFIGARALQCQGHLQRVRVLLMNP